MFITLLTILAFLFSLARPVHAYLDPGTGSYMTQIAIGFLLGGAYVGKTYLRHLIAQLRQFFQKRKKTDEQDAP